MQQHEKILNQIVETIRKDIDAFQGQIPALEKKILEDVIDLARDLEIKNGRIVNSVANTRAMQQMMQRLERLTSDSSYSGKVDGFTKAFDAVQALQHSYFSSLVADFKPKKVLGAIKRDAINYTIDQLTAVGISAKVAPGMEQILIRNIKQGGSFSSLMEEMRTYLTTTTDASGNKTLGALERHTQQITTDSLNQFSAVYNNTISADLGFKWRMYTGSLLETSRPWCVLMIDKKYVHESELATVINDNIDGVKLGSEENPVNKKTGLPRGMMPGTNAVNVGDRRGGYQCGHQFGAVPDAVVPLAIRQKLGKSAEKVEPKPKPIKSAKDPEQQQIDEILKGVKRITTGKVYSSTSRVEGAKMESVVDKANGAIEIINDGKIPFFLERPETLGTREGAAAYSQKHGVKTPMIGPDCNGQTTIDSQYVAVKIRPGQTVEFKSLEKQANFTIDELLASNKKTKSDG